MPLIRISMKQGRSAETKQSIKDAVHKAFISAFKIPETDRTILVQEYAEADFDVRNKNFTIVEVSAFSGRSKDAKRQLYKEIVENMHNMAKIEPQDVFIIVNDIDRDNWGVRGGKMASETDIGFKVDV